MAGSLHQLFSAREYFAELGFDTLPLVPGSKRAGVVAWQSRPSHELWFGVGDEYNIGIRCGGKAQLAVIDCDDKERPGTADNICNYLHSMGISQDKYPLVETASHCGRHIYLRILNAPQYRSLSGLFHQVGAGEFRFGSGAYVVAPPSVIKENQPYTLLSGNYGRLPEVPFNDLLPVLNWKETQSNNNERHISRFANQLLKGEGPNYFKSRSEAEEALICSLINTGHDYLSIERLFHIYPGHGKFREKYERCPSEGIGYLERSYYSALEWTRNNVSEGRLLAEEALEWAVSKPWAGRTGAYDRDIFLAHAQIAWKCGKVFYAASCRELAERANISHVAAANGTKRLMDKGLIVLEKPAVATLANVYKLGDFGSAPVEGDSTCDEVPSHDLFCYQGLGKSSKLIVEQLSNGSKTEDELVTLTGKTKPTVSKWLVRMARIVDRWTGEIVPLVYERNGVWSLIDNPNFDYFARLLQVSGKQAERKRVHFQEREGHSRALQIGRRI